MNAEIFSEREEIAADLTVENLRQQFSVDLDLACKIVYEFDDLIAMKKHATHFFQTQLYGDADGS